MKRLVIDDVRTFKPINGITVYARTLDDAMHNLLVENWDEVWWDHDLGKESNGDAIVAAKFMESLEHKPNTRMVVHTMNPVGREALIGALRDYPVEILPPNYLKDYLESDDG
jgi:hypothetical protein